LLSASLAALSAPVAAADPPITERARAHFTAGVNLLQDPEGARYEEAYREFKAAYAESPSWKVLGNLGLTAMKLERDGEAIDAYERYLKEGGTELDAEERAQIQRDLSTLKSGTVTLTLQSSPAGATITDERQAIQGQPIKNAYGPLNAPFQLRARSGQHHIVARLAGYEDQVWDVDAQPGQAISHTFELQARASDSPSTPTATGVAADSSKWGTQKTVAVVAAGVGVVGVALGTVFFVQYNSKNSDAKDVCPSGTDCEPGSAALHASLVDDAKSARTLTYVGWGVGAGALIGAAALYFTAPKPRTDRATWNLVPTANPGNVGASFYGTF
jgi:hypothetical protein